MPWQGLTMLKKTLLNLQAVIVRKYGTGVIIHKTTCLLSRKTLRNKCVESTVHSHAPIASLQISK